MANTVTDLSILIPARNEMFLTRTVEDILKHSEADTEIIVALDGSWPDPGLPLHLNLSVIYFPQSIGQRAATNAAAKIACGRYFMKADAHCSFDQGFDRKMLEKIQPNWTMVPIMKNLHAFDWICKQGHRRYQSPSGVCEVCGEETVRDVVWLAKDSPNSTAYCFDIEPHFQYFNDFRKRKEGRGEITETMSLQGSCFMLSKDKYWELNICDEAFGSWGSQGIEVAIKTWLSGGRVVCNQTTWYAHMFRTQGGDFSFPYPQSGEGVNKAKKIAKQIFIENKWEKAKHTFGWLVRKFAPVSNWPSKGVIYYTDNRLKIKLAKLCQKRILDSNLPITSSSLKPMINFGKNILILDKPGILTMFKQILAALKACEEKIVFFCEHDVLYHNSHFDFMPVKVDVWYYNTNVWKITKDKIFRVDDCRQTSGICVYRELAIDHYRKRVERIEKFGYNVNIGFEPGTHNRSERIDEAKSESWESEFPNIDIRHGNNLTPTKTSPGQFRNSKFAKGWQETQNVPGWEEINLNELFKL